MKSLKLYISYHHGDNVTIDEDRGWVENFTRLLDMMVRQVYNLEITFCNSRGEDGYTNTRLSNTDAALLILSPNYLEDPQCKEEMKQLGSAFNTEQLFKVVKYPITDYSLNGLSDLTSYRFYAVDRETGKARTYQNLIDTNLEASVWMKIMDLAEALIDSGNSEKEEGTTSKPGKTVYLADTGSLLSVERNIIRRELSRFGFNVLPKDSIPIDESKAKPIITDDLERSSLSIHLIDNKVYIGKDNTHWDLAMIQNRLAMEQSDKRQGPFSRLIWIPREEEEEAGFEQSEDQLEFTRNAEVLQSSIEDLKNVLKNNLVLQSDEGSDQVSSGNEGAKKVYLIYDRANESEIQSLLPTIREQGFEVLLPLFDNDLLGVRDQHISNLRNCDLAIIYFKSSDNIWLRMKFLDLVKSPGMGRIKGNFPKVIIHDEEQKIQKEFFEKHGTHFHPIGGSMTFLKKIK